MLLKKLAYPAVTVVYFTDVFTVYFSKTAYCIRFVMVCKIFSCSRFPTRIEKIEECKAFCVFACAYGLYLLY